MPDWDERKLGDLIAVKHGFAFKGEYFSEDPAYPILVTPGNFAVRGGFKEGRVRTYSGPQVEGYAFAAHDLILTMTDLSKTGDTLGYPALVPPGKTYLHNQRIGLVEFRSPEVIPGFLYYALTTSEYRQHILATATGSTVRHTSPGRIGEYTFRLPPLHEQQAIGSVLGVLDDKIAVNHRITSTADSLRSALWEGAQKGRPEDFLAKPLSQVADFINGRAFTKDATRDGRMVIRIAEINSGPGASTVYNDITVDEKHLARPGDVLFSWSGTLAIARWFRPEAIINQHIFKVIPRDDNPQWLIFEAVRSKLVSYRAVAADKATTMGHIQRRHLDEDVIVPNADAMARLDQPAAILWRRALEAEQETLILAALRDTLLPELMSGRLRVRDAEKIVEETV